MHRHAPFVIAVASLTSAAAALPAQHATRSGTATVATQRTSRSGAARVPHAASVAPPIGPAHAPSHADSTKRAMTVADIGKWRSVRDVALSDDGVWASYAYQQRRVDDTLYLKNLMTGVEQKVPRASRVLFSDDSKWVAYSVADPVRPEAVAESPATPGPARMELRNLATGATIGWENVASFGFSKGSNALMMRKGRAGGGAAAAAPASGGGRGGRGAAAPARVDGTDMILHHLHDGYDELVGSVSAAEFNRDGSALAYTVSSADREGNGLYVIGIGKDNWQRRTLDNSRADYARMTWDDSGSAIAALRGVDNRAFAERENTLIAFSNLDGPEPAAIVLGRTQLSGLADSLVLSEKGTLSWSPDHSKIFVGLKPQEARPLPVRRDSTAVVEPVGNVDVWHWKDPYIQSVQMVRAQQDRNRTFTAAVLLAQKKLVQLADDRMDRVQVTRDGNWAIGQDDKEYVDDWKPQLNDIYRVSTTTGERTPVAKGQERTLGTSPDGKFLLYWKDRNVWSYDIASNKHVNITKSAPVSFVNAEDDHVGEKPAYGVSGYTKDGKSVILEHKYDLWVVSLDGSSAPRNLTGGVGSKTDTRLRYVALDAEMPAPAFGGGGRGGRGAAEATIDLSKPMLLSAFTETDKKAGFYQLDGSKLTKLVDEDRVFGRPIKAKNADRVLVTRETFAEFPDYWVTDTHLSNPQRLTTANPQQAQFRWGHRILFDYKDKDGHKLQGTLAIPDGYQTGDKLPMLVDFYEKNSQNLNHYEAPRYANSPQYVDYVSNGYLMMVPDIYYHTGRSHTDMLNSIEAAVKKVEELGYADPKRVGLHGHSYSGQGAAYVSTQSKLFAAVVAGAAAVDLVADFNQLWKTSGTNQHRYDTYGQGRFGTNPYENLALFQDQSAIFHAQTMNTPLLIEQGTNDGSTEWLQGVEFYNALRFLKKPVIFLSYEGEAHGYTRYDNQYDVEVRMHQFYDHYLKGAPAADWIANGVPFLKKRTPTGAAALPVTIMGGGAGIGTPMTSGGSGTPPIVP